MGVLEIAKQYVEVNVLENLKKMAEKIYHDGYCEGFNDGRNDGYCDGYNDGHCDGYNDGYKMAHNDRVRNAEIEIKKRVQVYEDMEYVDLGLPSGTKWAVGFMRDNNGDYNVLPFEEAQKLNIPTQEQYAELTKYCKYVDTKGKIHTTECSYIGPNGKVIRLHSFRIYKDSMMDFDASCFWLMDCTFSGSIMYACNNALAPIKKGQLLPVLLVK